AQALRLALADAGIECAVDNDLLQGAVGELPLGWATAPRLIGKREVAAEARRILEELLKQESTHDSPVVDELLQVCALCNSSLCDGECPQCHEKLEVDPDTDEVAKEDVSQTQPYVLKTVGP